MKKSLFALVSLLTLGGLFGQTAKNIISIDGKEVPLEEFIYVYEKNNSKQKELYTEKSLKENADLFVNYRLKITEAVSRKMDTSQAFKKEFEGYRKQLAKPYMSDASFTEKMTKEAYDRTLFDVSTSHILFMVDQNAAPEDTLVAYNKALEVRKKIMAGADFGQMAIEFSEDPSAKEEKYTKGYKGFLGYNPAFSFVYPYETASYNTAVGQVSMPVRSSFGYHLIKVNDKRKNEGEVRVAHIMIEAKEGIDQADSLAKKGLIDEIYESLKKGGNWGELCAQHSTDKRTSANGGEMPSFQLDGKLRVPEFEYAAFALKNVGDISKPVKSAYGWHVIKMLERIPVASYEAQKDKLTKEVKRSDRFGLSEEVVNKKLKAEYGFKETKNITSVLSTYADSSLVNNKWAKPVKAKVKKVTFTLDGKKYTVGDFFTYVVANQNNEKNIQSPSFLMTTYYNKYVNQLVYNYAEANLSNKHKDYRLLLKEFRDGILFFDIMQKEVWNKASADTAGIKTFYEANKQNYKKPAEIDATVYKAKDLPTLEKVEAMIKAGKTPSQITEAINKESALNLTEETKVLEVGKEDWMKELGDQQQARILSPNTFMYVVVNKRIAAGIKELNQCKGLVISDYQNQVEKDWVQSLKNKYKVIVNQDTLNSLVK
jgi:peptidyl-prolyl cis-trans isomerase SurA